MATACSSPPEPVNGPSPTPSSNTVSAGPGSTVAPMPTIDLPPATANKISPDSSIANRANRPQRADANPNATPAPLQFKPAPENSRFAVAMQADGSVREVRIFDRHPTLMSVEAISTGRPQKDVTIKLRSGEVVRKRTDRLTDLAGASSRLIAELVGK